MAEKEDGVQAGRDQRKFLVYLFMVLGVAVLLSDYFYSAKNVETIPYSQFLKYIDDGQVSEVSVSDTKIVGKLKTVDPLKQKNEFYTIPVTDDTLVTRLQEKGVTFKGEPRGSFWTGIASWIFPLIIFYFLWSFLFQKVAGGAQAGLFGITKSKAKVFVEKDITTTFADVAGIDEAKEELEEIVSFLREPEKYKRVGGRAPKGVLLVGPPGTGKTLLARALAGEAKVPFFSINGSEFVEMFVGLGAARVRELFLDAKKQAPCIIFIDEIDALGKARGYGLIGGGANDEKEQTLHQLLAELDGFDSSQGVIILAATNRPEVLDPALLRAGRFDRQVLVNFPDQNGRIQILKVHIKKIKLSDSIKLEQVASLTAGFSGADLANLVNEAALVAVRRNAEVVSQNDFTEAIERVVAGLEHKKRVMNPEEKRRVAYHEMGHATVLLALNLPEKIHKVSIIPRGLGALGYTIQRPTEDRYIVDSNELLTRISVLLGGRASEHVFFPTVSTGAADDLVKATELARSMVTQYAMSENLGLQSFEQKRMAYLPSEFGLSGSKNFSEKTAQDIDAEIKAILDKSFKAAVDAVIKHKIFVEQGAQQLLNTETLDEHQISKLWLDCKASLAFGRNSGRVGEIALV
jgi:cell division protease FtsH